MKKVKKICAVFTVICIMLTFTVPSYAFDFEKTDIFEKTKIQFNEDEKEDFIELPSEEVLKEVDNDENVSKQALSLFSEIVEIEGTGTASDPYLITNEKQLRAISNEENTLTNKLSAHYQLQNDIELSNEKWIPIGGIAENSFKGSFDGNNFKITNVIIDSDITGFFQQIGKEGTVKNLGIFGNIKGNGDRTGGIAAYNDGIIENCYFEGLITAERNKHVGGLAGDNQGTIKNCYTNSGISSISDTAGGLAGNNQGIIENCYSLGNVNGGEYTGGLIGLNDGSVKYCYASGTVTGKYAGGLIGSNNVSVENSYALGNIIGEIYAGGLIGNNDGVIKYCYAVGIVNENSYDKGGLVGVSSKEILYSYFNSENTGNNLGFPIKKEDMKKKESYYGWDFENVWSTSSLVNNGFPYINLNGSSSPIEIEGNGTESNPYIITNEFQLFALAKNEISNGKSSYFILGNNINITAQNWTPIESFKGNFDGKGYTISGLKFSNSYFENTGLFGKLEGGTIVNLNLNCDIQGSYNTGGIAGSNVKGFIKNCTVTGRISGEENIGAIAGYNDGNIENSNSNADVFVKNEQPKGKVGGIIGYNNGSVISCYSEGKVLGYDDSIAGGLVGENGNLINYSYSSSRVNGDIAGGLVGYNSGKINYSYALGDVGGSNIAGGLVGNNYGDGTIKYCYAVGTVNGSGDIGGLVGIGGENVLSSYYNNDSNIGNKIGFGELNKILKFKDTYYGWNFENIWSISPTVNNGYPYIDLNNNSFKIDIEGSGTSSDPYIITNERQLIAISFEELSNKAYYKLGNDIKITSKHWTPIGGNMSGPFSGQFDGNGYTISDLTLKDGYFRYAGLFGVISGGKIINLNLNCNIDNALYSPYEDVFTGGLVGFNNVGNIENCKVNGSVISFKCSGGIAGKNKGTIRNSSSNATIEGTDSNKVKTGGIAGFNDGTVDSCYSGGNVINKGFYAFASYSEAGGLVGGNNGLIQYSYSNANVFGNQYTGGLVGRNNKEIRNSYSTGSVDGDYYSSIGGLYLGGLVGENNNVIKNCYSIGEVGKSGNGYKGGLVGSNYSLDANIINSYYDTLTSGQSDTDKGIPLNTEEIKNKDTFTDWDFEGIWNISSDINNGYPYLMLDNDLKVTGINFDISGKTISLNESIKIQPNVTPQDALNKSVVWKSSNTSVATVDITGLVKAVNKGTAVITATTVDGGYTASCTITVDSTMKVTGIKFGKETLSFELGNKIPFEEFEEMLDIKIEPENATNKNLNWEVDNGDIFILDIGSSAAGGMPGTAVVTATTEDGGYTASCTITVESKDKDIKVTGIKLDKEELILATEMEKSINALIEPKNATNKNIIWKSSDDKIAKVNNGLITALSQGTAVITATTEDGGYTANCKVIVDNKMISDIATVKVNSVNARPGNEVDISVSIKNNPGIATFLFKLNFDNTKMTPISVSKGNVILNSGGITSNIQQDQDLTKYNFVSVAWNNISNINDNGNLFNIRFKLKEDIPYEEIPLVLEYNENDISNQNFENVALNIENGKINLLDILMGDILEDGEVNMKDILKLSQYLSGWDIKLSENEMKAADVFPDEKIDMKDTLKLAQYLANWSDVVLGQK